MVLMSQEFTIASTKLVFVSILLFKGVQNKGIERFTTQSSEYEAYSSIIIIIKSIKHSACLCFWQQQSTWTLKNKIAWMKLPIGLQICSHVQPITSWPNNQGFLRAENPHHQRRNHREKREWQIQYPKWSRPQVLLLKWKQHRPSEKNHHTELASHQKSQSNL